MVKIVSFSAIFVTVRHYFNNQLWNVENCKTFSIWMTLLLLIIVIVHCTAQ